ncbi:MAG: hypothetical protein LBD04_11340 [Synergistaceae bacterium]|nr:hypothetical protein [Synergistaceae bacterium]
MKKKLPSFVFMALVLYVAAAFAAEGLSFQKLAFADGISGLGQYTPHPGARFTLLDTCSVYIEAAGFANPRLPGGEDEYGVDLAVDVAIRSPSGRRLFFEPGVDGLMTKTRSKLPMHFFAFSFPFEGWDPGTYVLEVGLRDNLSRQTVSRDLTFQVEKPTNAEIKAMQEREAQEATSQR